MSKATITSFHRQGRIGSFSTHGSVRGTNLLGWDEIEKEILSLEQQQGVLRHALAEAEKAKNLMEEDSDAYLAAKKRVSQIHSELRFVKAKLGVTAKYQDVGTILIQMFKERVTKPEWKAIVQQARERHDKQEIMSELMEILMIDKSSGNDDQK